MTMQLSSSETHLHALDIALALGLDLIVDGVEYRFKPLRYTDMGEMIVIARSEAMTAYLMSAESLRAQHKPIYHRDRILDVNAIMFGMQPQDMRSLLRIPRCAMMIVERSLRDHKPDITPEQVRAFLDDPETITTLLERIISMSAGAASPEDIVNATPEGESSDPTAIPAEAAA